MITLNDYLYSGDTVIKILHNYTQDLRKDAIDSGNPIDLAHSALLSQMSDFLEHNDFLTSQSQRMREFYKYMIDAYPDLAFTFKGRIKSLIRAESKFNGEIVSFIYHYYKDNNAYPSAVQIQERLFSVQDLIAYRIVISMPRCYEKDSLRRKEKELEYLYDIANKLPIFLQQIGFEPRLTKAVPYRPNFSPLMDENARKYYKDFIINKSPSGYQSLHITFYDQLSKYFFEVQLRTHEMDNYAEIGPANHMGYELRQDEERARRDAIPVGECIFFDEAYERVHRLQQLKLNELDVNMFSAVNNTLINDGCGLFRGRAILPYEHLSRFQNGLVD